MPSTHIASLDRHVNVALPSQWSLCPSFHLSIRAKRGIWSKRVLIRKVGHSLRMGWRNFFSSCAVVSVFWLWWEIVLGVTYLPYQLCHCVLFFFAAGNSFGLHTSVFWLWQEIVLGVTY
jgi:hypothetical protein